MRGLTTIGLLMVAAVNAAAAPLSQQASDDALIGLWGNEEVNGPSVRGTLTIAKSGSALVARIAGTEARVRTTGDSVTFSLPGGQGSFRGRFATGKREIRGFWQQPLGTLTVVPYVSPVTLSAAGATWRGTVTPVDDRWSIYLSIRRDSTGALRGVFRNPEINWRPFGAYFRVVRDRDTLRLLDPDSGVQRTTVGYDQATQHIIMDFGRVVTLTRRSPENAAGFYPRAPGTAAYEYRAPSTGTDGWQTARAADVGIDEARLAELVRMFAQHDPIGPGLPLVHSVLVARKGRLVLEEYFRGFDESRTHDMRSASKTFASVMVGAAKLHGASLRETTPVYSLLANDRSIAAKEPRKQRITLAHLLTHSSGLACDDGDKDSPGNEGTLQSQPDWNRYMLELPVVHEPGSKYAYCSGGLHLAGAMLRRATGLWLPELFDRYLAREMGIERYAINLAPNGDMYTGGGVQMRPRDLLKFGQLYLDGGTWNGRRLVDADWVKRSTQHQIRTNNNGSDGYAWHRNVLRANGREYQEYEANGNGGQFLIVIPELELAVVFTAGNYVQYLIWRRLRDEIVPQYVMSAIAR